MSKKILLATNNQGKKKELEMLLKRENIDCIVTSLEDYPEIPEIIEDGKTFKENAYKKAKTAAEYTGLVTIADDSGLEVDYLSGAPGIYSARYAGEPKSDERNNGKLLKELEGVSKKDRTARFRCAIAIVTEKGEAYFTKGTIEGIISESPQGSSGFGYDPLLYLPEYEKTVAEIPLEIKNQISHRAKAFKEALGIIKKLI